MMVSTDAREITMSRAEYDAMVTRHPAWMQDAWPKFWRSWGLYGVTARGCAGSGLAERLNAIRAAS